MARYAVGHIDFYNNDLTIEIVQVTTWKDALAQHSKCKDQMEELPDDLPEAKQEFFNQDSMFDVKLIED